MSDSQENVTGKVVIKDSSIKAVEVMLRYIYTGDIPCYLAPRSKNYSNIDIYALSITRSKEVNQMLFVNSVNVNL